MSTVVIAVTMGIMYWWCRGMIFSYFGFVYFESGNRRTCGRIIDGSPNAGTDHRRIQPLH